MWFNFHTHSTYCDGKSTLDEIVGQAILLNMGALGFSSHAPLPFDCNWCMKQNVFKEYLSKIQTLKNSRREVEIYSGLEVDYIPGVIGPSNFNDQLDYTIGSIHFVEHFKNGRGWEIDGMHHHFLEGLTEIFNSNIKDAVHRYFELTREMIIHSTPTVVGHLDKIKIQNSGEKFFKETEPWYQNEIIKTLEVIKDYGCILEVNTRGIYQKKTTSTYPSRWILELMLQKKIPVVVSSDAHHKDDLINHFKETLTDLRKIGFKEIHSIKNGRWTPHPFDETGVK